MTVLVGDILFADGYTIVTVQTMAQHMTSCLVKCQHKVGPPATRIVTLWKENKISKQRVGREGVHCRVIY